MAKPKMRRVSIRIDMTPMVDVAFLLLTFFMLTTQFRPPEEVVIELPSSHSAFKVPDSDVLILTVDKDGNIFVGLDSQVLRARVFGEENKYRMGIQVDKNDLGNILIQARMANPKLRTIVKGDKNAPYGPIEDVMTILQKVKITRFNLVTDLERT
ncbi:MAG: ExbD/TolR family protein [Candidatus Zhuqueibacterota bacterium]